MLGGAEGRKAAVALAAAHRTCHRAWLGWLETGSGQERACRGHWGLGCRASQESLEAPLDSQPQCSGPTLDCLEPQETSRDWRGGLQREVGRSPEALDATAAVLRGRRQQCRHQPIVQTLHPLPRSTTPPALPAQPFTPPSGDPLGWALPLNKREGPCRPGSKPCQLFKPPDGSK